MDKAIVPPLSHDTGIMLALRKEEGIVKLLTLLPAP